MEKLAFSCVAVFGIGGVRGVDKRHSKQSGGTGLGLPIVKHAMQYHHGNLEIYSEARMRTAISVGSHDKPSLR